jgi:hypothetical protein
MEYDRIELETNGNDTDCWLKQIKELRMIVDEIKMVCNQEQDIGMGQDNLEVNGKGEYEIMMIHNGI